MRVVNVRGMQANDPAVVYCGRPFAGWRGSPLANPFRLRAGDERGSTIAAYKTWLWKQIQLKNEAVIAELTRLATTLNHLPLGCWCAPLPCHCDVISACIDWIQQTQLCPPKQEPTSK